MPCAGWQWDDRIEQRLVAIRRRIHQRPELSFQEYETYETIGTCLKEWGIPFRRVLETGIVVDIWGERGEGRSIALRADMDALPIQEESDVPFSSERPGVMHACGHDGHTAMLLGAVYHLWKHRAQFSGLVRCIFQPGEEADGAAKQMIEAGVLDHPRIDAAVALHLWPHLPFGSVGIKEGGVTAACDDFTIEIVGKAGHGARPHQAVDAIAIGAEVIQSFQYLAVKMNNPIEPLVIHVGKIQGGTASNVIADRLTLEGTIRTLSESVRVAVKEKFLRLVSGIAEQYGGRANISYRDGNPAVWNDPRVIGVFKKSAAKIVGDANVLVLPHPSMGADDFGYFAREVPSVYFRLGIRQEGVEAYDLHHPKFSFDEAIIPIGAKLLTQTAITWLQEGRSNDVYSG
jgi:amidohydrolase